MTTTTTFFAIFSFPIITIISIIIVLRLDKNEDWHYFQEESCFYKNFELNYYNKMVMNYKGLIKIYEVIPNLFEIKIEDNKLKKIIYKEEVIIVLNFHDYIKAEKYFNKIERKKQRIVEKVKAQEKIKEDEKEALKVYNKSLEYFKDMKAEIEKESEKEMQRYNQKLNKIEEERVRNL